MSETVKLAARDGTGQAGRMLRALEPQYVSVEERSDEDLLKFLRAYAERLRFFNEKNEPEGCWSALFNVSGRTGAAPDEEIRLIAWYMNDSGLIPKDSVLARNLGRPHLVLLLAFLHLLRHPRQQFRDITRRHLEYYYRDVLKLAERAAIPDSLYAVFDLSKGYDVCHIRKGTLLDAGKDSLGIDIRYATDEDIVVNRARLASIKTIYAGKYRGHVHTIHAASIADAAKGTAVIPPGARPFVNIPDGNRLDIGFAVTSPVLALKEEERTIVVTLAGGDGSQLPAEFTGRHNASCPFAVNISTGTGWLKISSPRLAAGNFIKGNAADTYHESELPVITEAGKALPFRCIINESDFDSSQAGRCIITDDGAIYRIKDITGETDPREMTLVRSGRVENAANFRCCALLRNALRFTLHLPATAPAVTAPRLDGSFHNIASAYPVIRFLLQGSTPETVSTSYYEQFSGFIPEKAVIEVKVRALRDMLLRNETALLDTKKPFEPFGASPAAGDGFYFVHPELAVKRLDALSLHIEWANLPADFAEYYQPYFQYGFTPVPITNTSFNAQLKMMLDQVWVPIGPAQHLFGEHFGKLVSLLYSRFDVKEYRAAPGVAVPISRDPLEMPRCFKLELGEPDFQHNVYPRVVSEAAAVQARKIAALTSLKLDQALKLMKSPFITKEIGGLLMQFFGVIKFIVKRVGALLKLVEKEEKKIAKQVKDAKKQIDKLAKETGVTVRKKQDAGEAAETPVAIPPPYVPVMKSISIDYTSSAEIDFSASNGSGETAEVTGRLFQLRPFGYLDLNEAPVPERCLLPRYDDEGYLYLGFAEMKPPSDISLLYRPEPGKIFHELKPVDIRWSYLSRNRWLDFDATLILTDTTDNLLNTGIISFSVPEDAAKENTVMPSGLHWLRAVAKENPGALPDMIGIETQTVMATFQDAGNAPEHLAGPLAALSVKGLARSNPGIKSVTQPAESFNGRMQESPRSFTTRVAERLRHKRRALAGWDYERLVLEAFPSVQKVKCLNQAELALLGRSQRPLSAGVVVVVVPDIRGGMAASSREPGVPPDLLQDITDYLKLLAPPFAALEVRNPRYLRLQYRMTVGLRRGYDPGYYVAKLNGELREFLSPWAYGKNDEICFYTGRQDSGLLRFVETREYVDFVADLKVVEPFEMQQNANYYPGPDVILVAAPEHIIDLVPPAGYREEDYQGLGYMIISTDFDVKRPQRHPGSIGRMRLGKDFTVKKDQAQKTDDSNTGQAKEH